MTNYFDVTLENKRAVYSVGEEELSLEYYSSFVGYLFWWLHLTDRVELGPDKKHYYVNHRALIETMWKVQEAASQLSVNPAIAPNDEKTFYQQVFATAKNRDLQPPQQINLSTPKFNKWLKHTIRSCFQQKLQFANRQLQDEVALLKKETLDEVTLLKSQLLEEQTKNKKILDEHVFAQKRETFSELQSTLSKKMQNAITKCIQRLPDAYVNTTPFKNMIQEEFKILFPQNTVNPQTEQDYDRAILLLRGRFNKIKELKTTLFAAAKVVKKIRDFVKKAADAYDNWVKVNPSSARIEDLFPGIWAYAKNPKMTTTGFFNKKTVIDTRDLNNLLPTKEELTPKSPDYDVV